MPKIVTTNNFIERSKIIHNNKYYYNKTVYKHTRNKVIIICPIHGEFSQNANSHLQGIGCSQCGYELNRLKQRDTKEQFIEKARKVHGDKYNYLLVDYFNCMTKVKIKCNICGNIFKQKPNGHLDGKGCSICSTNKRANLMRSNKDEFIEESIQIHSDKYDYSKVIYINNKTKVTIICPEHGEFYQRPNDHLNCIGCPKCDSSKGEITIRNILNKNNIKHIQEYKLDNKYRLWYDFYLPDYNLLVEFQGGQHFKPIEYFGGLKAFKLSKERDIFKKELAKLYGIKLIYFTYKHLRMSEEEFEKFIIMIINKMK